jgi:CheY-like chemotaxis protein
MVFNSTTMILSLLEAIFKQAGYDVAPTLFGVDEVVRIKEGHPDLVILDCPQGLLAKGWLLIQQIRSIPEFASLPIVLCVSSPRMGNLKTYLRIHRIVLLLKPYDVNDLLICVKQADALSERLQDPDAEN